MKTHKLKFLYTLIVLSLLTVVSQADENYITSQNNTNHWVLSISGGGATAFNQSSSTYIQGQAVNVDGNITYPNAKTVTTSKNNSVIGLSVGLGYTGKLGMPYEVGIRQGFGYSSDTSSGVFDTVLYNDWTLVTYKKIELFAGANVGVTYGDTTTTWSAGPEAGVRVWLAKNVDISGRAGYNVNLQHTDESAMKYAVSLSLHF